MNNLRARRIYVIAGSLLIGAGTGAAADVLVEGNSTSPLLPMLMAGFGLGVMVAAVIQD